MPGMIGTNSAAPTGTMIAIPLKTFISRSLLMTQSCESPISKSASLSMLTTISTTRNQTPRPATTNGKFGTISAGKTVEEMIAKPSMKPMKKRLKSPSLPKSA